MTPWHKQPTHLARHTGASHLAHQGSAPGGERDARRTGELEASAVPVSLSHGRASSLRPSSVHGSLGPARTLARPRRGGASMARAAHAASRASVSHSPRVTRLRAGSLAEACPQQESFPGEWDRLFSQGQPQPSCHHTPDRPGFQLPGHTKALSLASGPRAPSPPSGSGTGPWTPSAQPAAGTGHRRAPTLKTLPHRNSGSGEKMMTTTGPHSPLGRQQRPNTQRSGQWSGPKNI